MFQFYSFVARSNHGFARAARICYRTIHGFHLPTPRSLRPLLWLFVAVRGIMHFLYRVIVCEPIFKLYCTEYGKRLRTGSYVHWVQGAGMIVCGDDVTVDGKCSFAFAARFSESPTLTFGSGTGIGHDCTFIVGRRIDIGRDCRIAVGVLLFDSSGHPLDPERRREGKPPNSEDVRPIVVGDNVWIGSRAIIFPGVTIGKGSVVSAGAVVTSDVPPYTVVGGNPARQILRLTGD